MAQQNIQMQSLTLPGAPSGHPLVPPVGSVATQSGQARPSPVQVGPAQSKSRGCWRAFFRLIRQRKETWIGLAALIMTTLALGPSYATLAPTATSLNISKWTAQKDFRESCIADLDRNLTSAECESAIHRTLPPPPIKKRQEMSNIDELNIYQWRYTLAAVFATVVMVRCVSLYIRYAIGRLFRQVEMAEMYSALPPWLKAVIYIFHVMDRLSRYLLPIHIFESRGEKVLLHLTWADVRDCLWALLRRTYACSQMLLQKSKRKTHHAKPINSQPHSHDQFSTAENTAVSTSTNVDHDLNELKQRRKVISDGDPQAGEPQKLLKAVSERNYAVVKRLLDDGIDPNSVFYQQPHNCLLAALEMNDYPIVQLLLSKGADPDFGLMKDNVIRNMRSVPVKSLEDGLERSIDKRELPEIVPILHLMLSRSNAAALHHLLKGGADPNATGLDGQTALHIVCRRNWLSCAGTLLMHGAEVNATNDDDETPLHITGCPAITELLLNHGANPEVKDKDGNSPIHNIVRRGVDGAIEIFLRRGVRLDLVNDAGLNALHIAIIAKNQPAISILRTDPCLLYPNRRGQTGLHIAVQAKNFTTVRRFVDGEIGLEVRDSKGRTALHCAALAGSRCIIHYLLNKGADINARDNDDETPLSLSGATTADIFISRGACTTRLESNELVDRARSGDADIVAQLLKAGTDTEIRDKFGQTALLLASGRPGKQSPSHEKIANLLISNGADVNTRSNNGAFPLLVAARSGRLDTCKLLLRHKADIEIRNCDGKTALERAIEEEAAGRGGPSIREVVRLLERHELGCAWFVGLEGGTGELVKVVQSEGVLSFECR